VSVALDTMILIWGQIHPGSRRGNPRQRDLVDLQTRSLILLDMLQESDETVIVPTITVSELLLGVEPDRHDSFVLEVQERFFCPPFDIRAATVAAKIWQNERKLPKDQQIQRSVLRAGRDDCRHCKGGRRSSLLQPRSQSTTFGRAGRPRSA